MQNTVASPKKRTMKERSQSRDTPFDFCVHVFIYLKSLFTFSNTLLVEFGTQRLNKFNKMTKD